MAYQINYEGVTFRSAYDFAETFGISAEIVRRRLRANQPITTKWLKQTLYNKKQQNQPVTLRGQTWPSQSAFARFLGSDYSYVCRLLAEGRTDLLEKRIDKIRATGYNKSLFSRGFGSSVSQNTQA